MGFIIGKSWAEICCWLRKGDFYSLRISTLSVVYFSHLFDTLLEWYCNSLFLKLAVYILCLNMHFDDPIKTATAGIHTVY